MCVKNHQQSAGFTMKPFGSPSNKLVATMFQQLGEWSPSNSVAHFTQVVHTLRDKKLFYNLGLSFAPFGNH
jgi:hypothetical protein